MLHKVSYEIIRKRRDSNHLPNMTSIDRTQNMILKLQPLISLSILQYV
jgi:hypothetical protein